MNPRLYLALVCALFSSVVLTAQLADPNDPNPVRGRYFVSPYGDDKFSGKLPFPNNDKSDGPFATFKKAQQAHRADTVQTTIYVRGGTYYLEEPLVLDHMDSGCSYVGFPGETVVLSGGKKIEGWKQSNGSIWTATVPEIRSEKWAVDQLRVGENWMTVARRPNLPAGATAKDGWVHTVYDGPKGGKMGAAISQIHNPKDQIDWLFDAGKAGEHYVWFLYSAQNARYRITDVGPRMTIRANSNEVTPLVNLRDTRGFVWARVAKADLIAGENLLRWENVQGGDLSLDAIALSDDVRWSPTGGRRPAAGASTILIQAESYEAERTKEIKNPETTAIFLKDRFNYKFGDINAYNRPPSAQVHIFGAGGEANTILPISRFDQRNRMIFASRSPNASLEIREGSRYFVANVAEELDAPSEWFADLRRSAIHMIPVGAGFTGKDVVAPKLDRLIEIKGNQEDRQWAQDIRIQGFTMKDTMYSAMFDPLNPVDAAIHVSYARNCTIEGNRIVDVGGHAVVVSAKSEKVEIVGNEIARTGQGGVLLLGSNETQSRDTVIAGNDIHDIGRILKHVGAVTIRTASGTKILNNQIQNVPRYAVQVVSQDARNYSHGTVIQNNIIRNACTETANGAAIEVYGRHKMETKTLIVNNWIENVLGLGTSAAGEILVPHSGWGINLNVYASGVTIDGNTIIRAQSGLVGIQGGRNNTLNNNVLVEGGDAQVFIWPVDSFCEGNVMTKNVSYFSTESGSFIKADGKWSAKPLAKSNQNLFAHKLGTRFFGQPHLTPTGPLAKWQESGKDIDAAFGDAGFENVDANKFKLVPGSPNQTKIGFRGIAYEKQGLESYDRSYKAKK